MTFRVVVCLMLVACSLLAASCEEVYKEVKEPHLIKDASQQLLETYPDNDTLPVFGSAELNTLIDEYVAISFRLDPKLSKPLSSEEQADLSARKHQLRNQIESYRHQSSPEEHQKLNQFLQEYP